MKLQIAKLALFTLGAHFIVPLACSMEPHTRSLKGNKDCHNWCEFFYNHDREVFGERYKNKGQCLKDCVRLGGICCKYGVGCPDGSSDCQCLEQCKDSCCAAGDKCLGGNEVCCPITWCPIGGCCDKVCSSPYSDGRCVECAYNDDCLTRSSSSFCEVASNSCRECSGICEHRCCRNNQCCDEGKICLSDDRSSPIADGNDACVECNYDFSCAYPSICINHVCSP